MPSLDTRHRGNHAEAAVLHAFLEAGLLVSVPFGGFCPYDLLVDVTGHGIARVLVKSGRVRNGCVIFNSCSTDHGSGRLDYVGRADMFAVHAPPAPDIYIVEVADATTRATTLRLVPTRNAQQRRVRFASDHTLAGWLTTVSATAAQ